MVRRSLITLNLLIMILGFSPLAAFPAASRPPQGRVDASPNDPVSIDSARLKRGDKLLGSLVLRVRNISDEPIYYVSLMVSMPEAPVAPGVPSAFQLSYGRSGLIGGRELPAASDRPIMPGEVVQLAVPAKQRRDAQSYYRARREKIPRIGFFIVRVQHVTFGGHKAYIANQFYNRVTGSIGAEKDRKECVGCDHWRNFNYTCCGDEIHSLATGVETDPCGYTEDGGFRCNGGSYCLTLVLYGCGINPNLHKNAALRVLAE